jgi:transcription elongation regulator 1
VWILLTTLSTAPGGQRYYYHAATNQSAWQRPLPPPPNFPHQIRNPVVGISPAQALQPKRKKEKPRTKEPIEGTNWIKVTTTEDNVFYSHKETKESRWDMPEEVKANLAEREAEAKAQQVQRDAQTNAKATGEEEEGAEEESDDEPIPEHEEEESPEMKRIREELDRERGVKRPPSSKGEGKRKKARVVSEIEELENDEDWQKSVAEEMAKEAERENQQGSPAAEKSKSPAPALGEYSSDESKALFKVSFNYSVLKSFLCFGRCCRSCSPRKR